MRHDTRPGGVRQQVLPDPKQKPGPGAQQRTLGASPPPLPSQATERSGVWQPGQTRPHYDEGDAEPLDPQNDDLDALALGPTGSDGDITDPDVARVFKEEQIGHGEQSGRAHAWHELRLRNGEDTELAVGDLDANPEDATFVGAETIAGGMVPPDANDVHEIGRSVGLNYQDNEPLDMRQKVGQRDDERWELNPASAEDWAERKHRDERKETKKEK